MSFKADIDEFSFESPEWVGFCRSMLFDLIHCSLRLCCSAIGGSRPQSAIRFGRRKVWLWIRKQPSNGHGLDGGM